MDINSKKPNGIGSKLTVSHGCYVDWATVPAGFDWIVVCALRIVAVNYPPLKEDPEGILGLIPVEDKDLSEKAMALELTTSELGKQLDFLSQQQIVPPHYGRGLITPLIVFERPDDENSKAINILNIEAMKKNEKFFDDLDVNLIS